MFSRMGLGMFRYAGPMENVYRLAGGETDVAVFDFANDRVVVRDTATPANAFDGTVQGYIDATGMSFTRATSASRTNASGLIETVSSGVWRREYDPVTLNPLGYLPEPQRTNLFTRSAEFDHANWSKSSLSVTADATVSPDGGTNADKLVEAAATAQHYAQQFISFTSGTSYSISVFAKAAERGFAWLSLPSAAFGTEKRIYVNLATGAVGTVSGSPTSYGAVNCGNGWWRIYIAHAASATAGGNAPMGISAADGAASYAGDGSSGAYLWGAQLEAGAYPTSYIPTAGSTVTRNADRLNADLTKLPYSAAAGTVIVTARPTLADVTTNRPRPMEISAAASTTDNIRLRNVTGGNNEIGLAVADDNVAQASILSGAGVTAARFKVAVAFATNDFELTANGASIGTDTSGTVPGDVTLLHIGGNYEADREWGAPIESLIYIARRLSTAELATRTTR